MGDGMLVGPKVEGPHEITGLVELALELEATGPQEGEGKHGPESVGAWG